MSNTGDALVIGNYFENILTKAGDTCSLSLHHSINPQVIGNLQAGVGLTAFGLKTETTTGAQTTGNDALSFPADISLTLTSH